MILLFVDVPFFLLLLLVVVQVVWIVVLSEYSGEEEISYCMSSRMKSTIRTAGGKTKKWEETRIIVISCGGGRKL